MSPTRFERASIPPGAISPNFFIIGAQKSGTTSLHTYVAAHPDVFMSEPKEPGFFAPEVTYYPRELDWYLSLFAGAGDATVVGESSTHYTKRPVFEGVAERMASFVPDARVAYVMRDPIRRAISHYWHNVRTLAEHRPILDALREEHTYRDFGDYELQLRPYVRHFGLERIHILTFEQLTSAPRETANEVLRWLGLGDLPEDTRFGRENARPSKMKKVRGRGWLERLRHNPVWEAVSPLAPRSLKSLGKRMAQEPVVPSDEHDAEVIEMLRPWARASIQRLEDLLDRDFPEWTTALGDASSLPPGPTSRPS